MAILPTLSPGESGALMREEASGYQLLSSIPRQGFVLSSVGLRCLKESKVR